MSSPSAASSAATLSVGGWLRAWCGEMILLAVLVFTATLLSDDEHHAASSSRRRRRRARVFVVVALRFMVHRNVTDLLLFDCDLWSIYARKLLGLYEVLWACHFTVVVMAVGVEWRYRRHSERWHDIDRCRSIDRCFRAYVIYDGHSDMDVEWMQRCPFRSATFLLEATAHVRIGYDCLTSSHHDSIDGSIR